ncbi:hypothetical protein G5I_06681 [Acromyrmex echinatior]|uniref:Uncharacterized protein n=1 Tax=Acromyrmex echinatior TaxID=103372 RepID=F4WLQ5_ACREC|nr:hypothetical protein G5I_06681 [Acromyrmex echinatior]
MERCLSRMENIDTLEDLCVRECVVAEGRPARSKERVYKAWHSMLVGARVICSRLRLHSDRGLFLRQTRTRSIDERDGRRSEEKSYREWTRSGTLRTLSLSKGPVTSRNCELEFNTAKSSHVGVTRLLYSEIDRRRNDKQGIYTIRCNYHKALDSSPKRSLLAAAAPRNVAPKIRVLAVGLLVDDRFVQPPRYPRRRARAERWPGIAMAPISSMQDAFNVSGKERQQIRDAISRDESRQKDGGRTCIINFTCIYSSFFLFHQQNCFPCKNSERLDSELGALRESHTSRDIISVSLRRRIAEIGRFVINN